RSAARSAAPPGSRSKTASPQSTCARRATCTTRSSALSAPGPSSPNISTVTSARSDRRFRGSRGADPSRAGGRLSAAAARRGDCRPAAFVLRLPGRRRASGRDRLAADRALPARARGRDHGALHADPLSTRRGGGRADRACARRSARAPAALRLRLHRGGSRGTVFRSPQVPKGQRHECGRRQMARLRPRANPAPQHLPLRSEKTRMSPIREPRTFRRIATALAPIIALAALLSLYRLGAADVCGFNEAVEGVFVQQMVEHGALLFPLDNSRAPLYKPPLFHWTATALDHLIGAKRVTPLNLRMTAALYAIAGVALTMWFACDFLGLAGATVAGLVLCGSYQYLENARVGRVDMTLCFFETLALFAFAWWLTPGRDDDPSLHLAGQVEARPPAGDAALRYLMAGALGLAVLAKGPVGILI